MDNTIEAHGLVKRFGETTALDGADLTARTGSVLAVLGPNGAGKTTAVRILATLLEPDEGRALVGGYDVVAQAQQVRQLIALTGQYRALAAPAGGWSSQTASTSWAEVTTRPGSRARRNSSRRSRAPATSTGRPDPARTSSGPRMAIRRPPGTPPFCRRPGRAVDQPPAGVRAWPAPR
jgi:ATPase subunit of ABC transporter with duplicated ATPase domains